MGATVVMPATHIVEAEVTVAWLRDPQRNVIGVVKNDGPAAQWPIALTYGFYLGHHQLGRNAEAARRRPANLERVVELLSVPREHAR